MKRWKHALTFFATIPCLLLISLLPFILLYPFSNLCYYLVYYIIRYRREVVWKNLLNAFPEKTMEERIVIQKDFYRHLCDLLLEHLKSLSITRSQAIRRCTLKNSEVFTSFYQEGRSILLLAAHQGNWEWAGNAIALQTPYQFNVLYQPLSNPYFDQLLQYIRQRFKRNILPQHQLLRRLLAPNAAPKATALLADQSPQPQQVYLTTFLNQPTSFSMAVEKLAKKLDLPVIYIHTKKIKRGYYELSAEVLCEAPTRAQPHQIIQRYSQILSNHITQQPSTWLWSHRRWKDIKTGKEIVPN